MENIDWLQIGAFFIPVLGLGLAGLAYLTRQFNRVSDRITHVEERLGDRVGSLEQRQARLEERMNERFDRIDERFDRVDERFDRVEESVSQMQGEIKNLGEGLQNVEKEQARMLGFLEGRGVMGKAPAAETVS